MSNRRPLALRLAFVFAALGACSGDETDRSAFPDEDASADDAPLGFDVQSADAPRADAAADRGPVTTDRGFADRGASETTVCPASCTASADCNPCRTADTPSTVSYCCISGLCVSMTGTCPASPGDGGTGDANDGSSPGDAFDPGDTPDPTDTPPDPTDDAGPPPDDVTSDLGGDAATAVDATAGDATAVDVTLDAAVAMDAADGGG